MRTQLMYDDVCAIANLLHQIDQEWTRSGYVWTDCLLGVVLPCLAHSVSAEEMHSVHLNSYHLDDIVHSSGM